MGLFTSAVPEEYAALRKTLEAKLPLIAKRLLRGRDEAALGGLAVVVDEDCSSLYLTGCTVADAERGAQVLAVPVDWVLEAGGSHEEQVSDALRSAFEAAPIGRTLFEQWFGRDVWEVHRDRAFEAIGEALASSRGRSAALKSAWLTVLCSDPSDEMEDREELWVGRLNGPEGLERWRSARR